MLTHTRVRLQTFVLFIFVVRQSQPVCVEVPSATEAVMGRVMRLTCISCFKREELKAKTRVDWYYMPSIEDGVPSNKTHIYMYKDNRPVDLDGPFKGRLTWNGSVDLQDVSIEIISATLNDSGIYECRVLRQFDFGDFSPSAMDTKNISLKVIEEATTDTTALYSEIMMYVLLVCLTLWLVVEMVYCYRKISKTDEQTQDTAY